VLSAIRRKKLASYILYSVDTDKIEYTVYNYGGYKVATVYSKKALNIILKALIAEGYSPISIKLKEQNFTAEKKSGNCCQDF